VGHPDALPPRLARILRTDMATIPESMSRFKRPPSRPVAGKPINLRVRSANAETRKATAARSNSCGDGQDGGFTDVHRHTPRARRRMAAGPSPAFRSCAFFGRYLYPWGKAWQLLTRGI